METITHAALPSVVLYPISLDHLESLISNAVKNQFDSFKASQEEDELITRKETASILGVSLQTLNEWVKTGKVPAFRVGSRVRFKRSEVENSLKKIQVA